MKFFILILMFLFSFQPASALVEAGELKAKYLLKKPIRVLIVPGHDNDTLGATYQDIKEVNINRVVAQKLFETFKNDPSFEPILAHQGEDYNPILKSYFETKGEEITSWRREKVSAFEKKMEKGEVVDTANPAHGGAKPISILRLYGTNKWINENNIDLTIHIHFNDYGSHKWNTEGLFTGFSIYVPEKQFKNGPLSIEMAKNVWDRFSKISSKSNQSQEGKYDGPIEDQDLIALGAFDTLEAPSILIEHGYIYEPFIQNSQVLSEASRGFAHATYSGIKDWFTDKNINTSVQSKLPIYKWNVNLKEGSRGADVFALQRALKAEGYYPAQGKTREDCPMTGYFGTCTTEALKTFQKDKKLQAVGLLGPKTRTLLNATYK